MPRTHGYAVKGRRCFGTHAWGERGRTNVIGALLAGVLLSPLLCDFNINSDIFHAWISDELIPNLPPGAVVVMDNASFHKRCDTQQAISAAGQILEYLPPYSPDLNPIEHKWAQAKAIRRKTGKATHEIFKRTF